MTRKICKYCFTVQALGELHECVDLRGKPKPLMFHAEDCATAEDVRLAFKTKLRKRW